MNRYGLTFHHFGLAAKQAGKAVAFLKSLGYSIGASVSDDLQNVNLVFCRHDAMPSVEIISPVRNGAPCPLDTFLKSSPALVYHLCFDCKDVQKSVAAMENDQHQVVCVSEPKPAILFGGREVSFYRISGFGLIELLGPAKATQPHSSPVPS